MAWFRRKESMDPQVLLARGHETTPPAAMATGFRMTVQDVFTIAGRGTVVVGRIEAGTISTGATVQLTRPGQPPRGVEIAGIEAFRNRLEVAAAGENVGLLLRAITKHEVAPGDVLSS